METIYGNFPYNYSIETARIKCKERYLGFKVINKIPKLLFPSKEAYTLCYAYFRWFDDIIDSRKLKGNDINFIVERQKRFLSQLYKEEIPEELSTEELFLAHLVSFDKRYNKNIRKDLETLVDTLEFDSNRRNKLLSNEELNSYIDNNVRPYVNISLAIFNQSHVQKEGIYLTAKAGFVIDYIYSLRDDINLGYVNISKEDIRNYNINLSDLNSIEIRNWIKDKLNLVKKQLCDPQFSSLSLLPKIISNIMLMKRKNKLKRIII